jgi:UTP--glucose-1-phosphate uridylyltransferase
MCAVVHKKREEFFDQIALLTPLAERLKKAERSDEKVAIFNEDPRVIAIFEKIMKSPLFSKVVSVEEEVVIKALIVLDQAERLFHYSKDPSLYFENRNQLLHDLIAVEKFYRSIGGLIGYHLTMLRLLLTNSSKDAKGEKLFYQAPHWEISQQTMQVTYYIIAGIKALPLVGQIYPVGGAGDRLNLHDPVTKEPLPAAMLGFLGKTLLEGLIEDVQAEEYLYYKLFHKQITTPIAMMTSREKENHDHILKICEEANWFHRPRESFTFFCQPLVPTIDEEGNWCLQDHVELLLKPGGHGVIWKLAQDEGVFEWFFDQGRKKALIRQINNPIASVDYGLLALIGIGCAENKVFGFASCPRKVESKEGMDILIEQKSDEGYEYCLTNIEYTDFQKYHIKDVPETPGSDYSKFPSNTNILFADLEAIDQVAQNYPIPGMLMNFKKSHCLDREGKMEEKKVARLESTMQNIADYFAERFPAPLSPKELKNLKTFLTYNERLKTISAAKREFSPGMPLLETPEGCFFDLMKNRANLLKEQCRMTISELHDEEEYLTKGPSFIFLYHPGLGPLYSVIGQKIHGGNIGYRAELQLEIVEVQVVNLDLEGSLLIRASSPLGENDEFGRLKYSEENGKCRLLNVKVRNLGIDVDSSNVYWKNQVQRKEVCEIIIRGNGEFYAENVTFQGAFHLEVPDGFRMVAKEVEGQLTFQLEEIRAPTWHWEYAVNYEIQKEEEPAIFSVKNEQGEEIAADFKRSKENRPIESAVTLQLWESDE